MANPQVESGHIRIANELYDEILRRNFTKRQQNLVLFIWRLSYGTGQKDCKVKHFNLFELAGLYRSDIRKELNYLKECSVLNWDEENMIFSINKNYKLWQISPNKNWNSERFNSLIHENIMRKNVSETLTNKDKEVSETLITENDRVSNSLTNKTENVSNSPTSELVKHQQRPSEKSSTSRGAENLYPLLETSLKDINNKDSSYRQPSASKFYEENGFGIIGGHAAEMLMKWLNKFDDEVLILAMKEAIENDAKNWRYMNRVLSSWEEQGVKTASDAKAAIEEFRSQSRSNYSGRRQTEVVPDWFKNRDQSEKEKSSYSNVDQEELMSMLQRHAGGND